MVFSHRYVNCIIRNKFLSQSMRVYASGDNFRGFFGNGD